MGQRPKMSRAERAKQFMPFAALKGYLEALRRKEKKIVPQIVLSEAQKEVLDWKLHQIRVKDIVTVIYYDKTDYVEQTGMVSRIDPEGHFLQIVNTRISFVDLYDIENETTESLKYGC